MEDLSKTKKEKKHLERLSFIIQFKIEFLLPFTGCRKVLGKMPENFIQGKNMLFCRCLHFQKQNNVACINKSKIVIIIVYCISFPNIFSSLSRLLEYFHC